MNLKQRINHTTPPFFKKIRNVGLAIAAIGGALLTAPVALPLVLVKLAGYLTVAGGIASAVSQTTSKEDDAAGGGNGQ
jgi:uncharacterized membrane protein HdeD (DUF308 family)